MEKWRCQVDKANDIDLEIWDVKLIIPHVSQTNKYRGGTSDATTSSSLFVLLFMLSVDDFSHSKTHIRRSKITG